MGDFDGRQLPGSQDRPLWATLGRRPCPFALHANGVERRIPMPGSRKLSLAMLSPTVRPVVASAFASALCLALFFAVVPRDAFAVAPQPVSPDDGALFQRAEQIE